jgi:peroxiredoxin
MEPASGGSGISGHSIVGGADASTEERMNRIRSNLLLILGGVTLVVLAYLLGGQAAGLYGEWDSSRNREKYQAKATEQTAAILRKMGTVKLGDTLPNYSFEDIDGNLHLLSQLVTDRTIITYIKPDCDACLTELEHLRSAAEDSTDYSRVLLISTANPLHLQRLKDDYGLGCRVLYDEERFFGSALNIQSFPFNLVIDRERVILEIHANPLLKADYERLLSVGRDLHGRDAGCRDDKHPDLQDVPNLSPLRRQGPSQARGHNSLTSVDILCSGDQTRKPPDSLFLI